MPVVNLTINGKTYDIACGDGDVDKVRALGRDLEERGQRLIGHLGPQPEGRLLVMIALMLADDLAENRNVRRPQASAAIAPEEDARLAQWVSAMAERLEAIAERFERP